MGLFDFFKKNKEENYIEIYSPLNGRVIDLSEVPDEAFAQKMIGDGCAIEPTEGSIHAIADAEIDIFDTNHAVSFDLECGLEMIVQLVKYNLEYITENAKSARTPIIISNMDDVAELKVMATGDVKVGDLLMKIKLKK